MSVVIDLGELTSEQGFVIVGDGTGYNFSVSSAGDVNGDGIDDLVVGSPYGDIGGDTAGQAYVIYGVEGTSQTEVDLSSLSAEDGFVVVGDRGDRLGFSVSSAGDVNEDGIDDLIIGAPFGGDPAVEPGVACVIYGVEGNSRDSVDLGQLSVEDGYIIVGDASGDEAGRSVSSVGDVNGDGIDDLIVGAPYGDDGGSKAGEAYVIYGREADDRATIDLSNLSDEEGFVIVGAMGGDYLGFSVSSAGDVNGDGLDDLVVGAPRGDIGGESAGEAYVIYGLNGVKRTTIDLANLSANDGFVIVGDEVGEETGFDVSTAGDVNGDGIDDLIVGAPGADDGGEAYVIYGIQGDGRGPLTIDSLVPSEGFIIKGDIQYDGAGVSVSSAGDVNGDGIDDLIVGASEGGYGDSGYAYVIYGVSGSNRTVLDLANLSANDGFAIKGGDTGDRAGQSVSAAGDVNGDGIDDLIVSSRIRGIDAGAAYVIYGFYNPPSGTGLPARITALEDTPSLVDLTGLVISDVDPTGDMRLVIEADLGSLLAETQAGVTATITADGQTLTLTGTLEGLQAYLQGAGAVGYLGPADVNGAAADTLLVQVDDNDGAGLIEVGEIVVDIGGLEIGGTGDDELIGGSAGDQVIDPGGSNTLVGNDGNDQLSTLSGENVLDGGSGDDFLRGGYDKDSLYGGDGADVLLGDSSNFVGAPDLMDGGTGDDHMAGGVGADTFVFRPGDGNDIIEGVTVLDDGTIIAEWGGADFVSGVDIILLDGFGLADGAAALALVSDANGVATFSDQGTTITFAGLTTADLSADDFLIL
jgi:hypothetical protein